VTEPTVATVETRKAGCSKCGGERNCDVFGHFENRDSDDYMSWCTDWYLMKCRGCDQVFVQLVSTNSEDYDDYEDELGHHQTHHHETISYYPAQSKRQRPDWLALIKVEGRDAQILTDTLSELYSALDSDLHVLAAIGMRTSFDAASELLGVDAELPFQGKLQALVESGHIGRAEMSRLEALVEAGSASAHRGWKANPEDLGTMMDVLEHFLNEAFVSAEKRRILDRKAQSIREKVPRRARPSDISTQQLDEASEV
jgi:Domain of unknown function (DUF4145)